MTRKRRRTATPAPPAPGAPLYEVVREHEESGRVQLQAWAFPRAAAITYADNMNRETERNGGKTLATSGHLEFGWRYAARAEGTKGETK